MPDIRAAIKGTPSRAQEIQFKKGGGGEELFAFAIYYKVDDRAFARAAETWKNEILADSILRRDYGGIPVTNFLMMEVSTERNFMATWSRIQLTVTSKKGSILRGNILSHASKHATEETGLEFKPGDPNLNDDTPSTLDREELANLAVLPWSKNDGLLTLSGCNTGLKDKRGWAPAEVLSQRQKVTTIGQSGYAYFSEQKASYSLLTKGSSSAYLWAYRRGQNGMLGDGKRMDGVIYRP